MLRYVVRRLLTAIPILLIASVIVFIFVRTAADPTTAIRSNPQVRAEDIQRFRAELGLDRSLPEQYFTWLGNFVRGDWGVSLVTNQPVWPEIREALGNTLVLGVIAFLFSLLVGTTIGVISAVRQYSKFDYAATGAAFVGLSMPVFWFALILQLVVGTVLPRWLGTTGPILPLAGMSDPSIDAFVLSDRLRHLVLPVLVLSVQLIAVYSRYTRASMLEVMHADYVRTARAKGLRERKVIVKHGLRNALIPLTTQAAIDVGALAGGLIITEAIFQWPGMGRLFVLAIGRGDYMRVLPWTMIVVGSVIVFNLIADILYAVLDPRIRYD